MTTAYRSGEALGWTPDAFSSTETTQLNVAANLNWFALSFVPHAALTLSTVYAYISAVAGSLAGTDITCDLYDSAGSNGAPGAAIESGKVPSATITAAGWYNWTGFTTALTAGVQYWVVFKNVNASQATNNCTFRDVIMPWGHQLGSSINRFGWGRASSTNGGSTWSTGNGRTALRLGYSDGSYDGLPISNLAAAASGDGVFATQEAGTKFASPASSVLRAVGLCINVFSLTGTPTNAGKLGLWLGATPVLAAYTETFPVAAIVTGGQWIYRYFVTAGVLTPIIIQPGTICRVTCATSGADASTKRFNLTEVTWDTDSASVAMLPWNGTATKTYYNGSSWSDSALGTSMYGHGLLLDTAQDFGIYQSRLIVTGQGTY